MHLQQSRSADSKEIEAARQQVLRLRWSSKNGGDWRRRRVGVGDWGLLDLCARPVRSANPWALVGTRKSTLHTAHGSTRAAGISRPSDRPINGADKRQSQGKIQSVIPNTQRPVRNSRIFPYGCGIFFLKGGGDSCGD